jgi:membrane fusion protein (multidrug efflux system)
MTTVRSFAPLTRGILFICFMLALVGCGSKDRQPDSSDKGDRMNGAVVPVEAARAERRNLSATKTYSGTLEGEEQANIVAKISERITGIKVRVGGSVSAGDVTIMLDKSGTSSQFYQAEANFKNAEKTLERTKSLYGEGAISLQTLDGTQTTYDVAKANFDAARSAVELQTPISGVVTAVNVSIGDLTTPGAVLATIANIARMKFIFNLNESDVTNLSLGGKVQVYSDTRPDTRVEGQIVQLSKSAEIRSRLFEIRAMFSNTADRWFKPGMFCRGIVQISPREKSLVIPNAALQSDGSATWVYVLREGRSYRQTVQAGVTDGTYTEITTGLAEHDSVATVGVNNLRDSSFVSVVRRPQ